MRVLVACEYSGAVRDEFLKRGHDAYSCDILPCESDYLNHEHKHYQRDVLEVINEGWDLMIAHPPCTHLAVSGARWFTEGRKPWSLQEEALEFVKEINPKKAYFTHISHKLGFHAEISKKLPKNVFLAYDGLKISV